MNKIKWFVNPDYDTSITGIKAIEIMARDVVGEIAVGEFDGYKCRNKPLSNAVAAHLATFTKNAKWLIYADFEESEQAYRVWIELDEKR